MSFATPKITYNLNNHVLWLPAYSLYLLLQGRITFFTFVFRYDQTKLHSSIAVLSWQTWFLLLCVYNSSTSLFLENLPNVTLWLFLILGSAKTYTCVWKFVNDLENPKASSISIFQQHSHSYAATIFGHHVHITRLPAAVMLIFKTAVIYANSIIPPWEDVFACHFYIAISIQKIFEILHHLLDIYCQELLWSI